MSDKITLEQFAELTSAMGEAISDIKDKISEMGEKVYPNKEDPYILDGDFVSHYKTIANNNGLLNRDCIGVFAILKNGESFKKYDNTLMYVNGNLWNNEKYELASEKSEDVEIVKILYFATSDGTSLSITDTIDIETMQTVLIKKTVNFATNESWYIKSKSIAVEGVQTLPGLPLMSSSDRSQDTIRNVEILGGNILLETLSIGNNYIINTEYFTQAPAQREIKIRHDSFQKIIFKGTKIFNSNYTLFGFTSGGTSLTFELPDIEEINASSSSAVFRGGCTIILPQALKKITGYVINPIVSGSAGVYDKIYLYNKENCEFSSNWCGTTSSTSRHMVYICPDWASSLPAVNLLARNAWSVGDYLSLFTGYTSVENPTIEEITHFYELINGEYVKTSDTTINNNKTYYYANLRDVGFEIAAGNNGNAHFNSATGKYEKANGNGELNTSRFMVIPSADLSKAEISAAAEEAFQKGWNITGG